MSNMRDLALSAKAWPFEEARRLLKRYSAAPPEKAMCSLKRAMGLLVFPILVRLAKCRAPQW